MSAPVLAVVVLQYGRWRDTVTCLQSLVPAVRAGLARVIVVDNASPDDSAARVRGWIHGGCTGTARPVHDTVASHWWPLDGDPDATWQLLDDDQEAPPRAAPWAFVTSGDNRGFAAGMNTGIRVALSDARVDAVWLLNNDTVVDGPCVQAIRAALDAAPATVGQFGTTVCYYDRPTIVQSVGWCRWNAWLATSQRLHDGASLAQPLSRIPTPPGYVYGASWVIRAAALRTVGLLNEESFLYGEELDWSCRARGWSTRLVAEAVVWHREGATIGAGVRAVQARSELADLCGISARLRLTRRFFPGRLPAVYSSLFGAALNRLRRGDRRRAAAVARLVLAGGLPAPRPTAATDHPSSSPP
ncbi:MAG: glycosyltransferase family 2 protein [Gemmatimonadaceae bacterium]|nr:glycosyltransferase family 2 protein [Gemmatimonadaceae bacterium]